MKVVGDCFKELSTLVIGTHELLIVVDRQTSHGSCWLRSANLFDCTVTWKTWHCDFAL